MLVLGFFQKKVGATGRKKKKNKKKLATSLDSGPEFQVGNSRPETMVYVWQNTIYTEVQTVIKLITVVINHLSKSLTTLKNF